MDQAFSGGGKEDFEFSGQVLACFEVALGAWEGLWFSMLKEELVHKGAEREGVERSVGDRVGEERLEKGVAYVEAREGGSVWSG